MKDASGPVKSFPLAEAAVRDFNGRQLPDFSDSEQTFRHITDGNLKQTALLFKLMGQPQLTNLLSTIGLPAVKLGLPGASWMVRKTVFPQFVGGVSLNDSLPTIERLHERGVTSILDYGAEAKNAAADFDVFTEEVKKAIHFSAENGAAVAAVVKITGLADDHMLEKLNASVPDLDGDLSNYPKLQNTIGRLEGICQLAAQHSVQVYIDAEESWLQNTIDALAALMMQRHNKEQVIVLHTYQLYRHDRLQLLKDSHQRALEYGYLLGAKLVRGAYMVKENARAADGNYPTPIQPSLEATHRDYNDAVRFCIDNVETVGFCIGSHNEESVRLTCELLRQKNLPANTPHAQFAQLYGMSDNLTFNLAAGGYNVSKYMVYGPVSEVLPYLVRRAQENTSVTGEMGRELKLIRTELERRRVG
ncbi:proline dehydrogenase family protein [Neolewinella antarctica]|uniref:Proline dehydrogenase n=1 Tax=Neolewinella antarctica TaxID=442734 RepID=A0ABX0X672_9BACT|nr:proline dehydrogenase family protein [Neolewinella antarctica]NJC24698.1 proline dehydrogenase [Neolewinella antarctica]